MRALSSDEGAVPESGNTVRLVVVRYGFALAAVALCAVVRWSLNPILEGQGLYLAFMIPIAASAYLGGYGPGVASITLSALLAGPLFEPVAIDPRAQLAHLTLFCLESVAVVVIIRRLQRAHDVARLALIRAEAANTAKEEFVARISHEWRSPVNVLLGWIGQVELRAADPEFVCRAAASMRRAVETQGRLVADVLDYSRGTRGKLSFALERVPLREPILRAVDAVRAEAQRKALDLRIGEPLGETMVDADVVRLEQVFVNLLSNAIKFTPAGGRIDVDVTSTASHVQVSIADTGVGIRGEALDSIFHPFAQSDPHRDIGSGGLGLGLAIVRDIVGLHHGDVSATSPGPGRGSTFFVRLPRAAVSEVA